MGNLFDAQDYVPMEINRENDLYVYHGTNPNDKIAGIIINITLGTSYDPLFSKVAQKSPPGTRVLVYHASYENLNEIINQVNGKKSKKPIIERLLNQIKQIDSDCTIINWECCSSCQNIEFPRGKQETIKNLKTILDKGHMAMFSDFSLKALIKAWDQNILGPNPFVFISEFGGNFKIGFDKNRIVQCPSSQLKIVGELSKESNCQLKALQKTIVYSLNFQNINSQKVYTVQLLTVALIQNIDKKLVCKINEYTGSAGHILIKFASGGSILASMGHWCELIKVKTSEEQLFKVAQDDYGKEYVENLQNQMKNLRSQQKQMFVSNWAINFVQQSTPGNIQTKKLKK